MYIVHCNLLKVCQCLFPLVHAAAAHRTYTPVLLKTMAQKFEESFPPLFSVRWQSGDWRLCSVVCSYTETRCWGLGYSDQDNLSISYPQWMATSVIWVRGSTPFNKIGSIHWHITGFQNINKSLKSLFRPSSVFLPHCSFSFLSVMLQNYFPQ